MENRVGHWTNSKYFKERTEELEALIRIISNHLIQVYLTEILVSFKLTSTNLLIIQSIDKSTTVSKLDHETRANFYHKFIHSIHKLFMLC